MIHGRQSVFFVIVQAQRLTGFCQWGTREILVTLWFNLASSIRCWLILTNPIRIPVSIKIFLLFSIRPLFPSSRSSQLALPLLFLYQVAFWTHHNLRTGRRDKIIFSGLKMLQSMNLVYLQPLSQIFQTKNLLVQEIKDLMRHGKVEAIHPWMYYAHFWTNIRRRIITVFARTMLRRNVGHNLADPVVIGALAKPAKIPFHNWLSQLIQFVKCLA